MTPSRTTPPSHEWISFEDDDMTWLFDVTFLSSNWTCIYGRGCQGVLTADAREMEQGCCSYGAHFADDEDRRSVLAAAERLEAQDWQFMDEAGAEGGPVIQGEDGAWTTRLADDACIFLNRPGFEGGAGCALHRAALRHGERPLDWKPDVCWQLPLRLSTETDEHGHDTHVLREWKRRDWGEGGADFHWWCTEGPEAFIGARPVYRELRDEIVELVGERVHAWMFDALEARRGTRGQAQGPPASRRQQLQ